MDKKTIIITGGSSGLGYQTAKNIARAKKDWKIIIASRNPERTQSAVASLKKETQNSNIEGMVLDVSILQSVRDFADAFKERQFPPLYGIIENAGAQFMDENTTKEGYESTFATNYLGHFLLIQLLAPLLTTGGRIIMVSSDTHDPSVKTMMPAPMYTDPAILSKTDASYEMLKKHSAFKRSGIRYTTAKLAIIYHVHSLARKLEESGRDDIIVNSFNPGLMVGNGSNLARNYNPVVRFMWEHMAFLLPHLHFFAPGTIRSTEISGKDLANLAFMDKTKNKSGEYWDGDHIIPSSSESYNQEREEQLWSWSLKETGVS